MSLSCPKCQSEMRSYERNRVLVDQCTGCGGLFLDKGELEQLATAENSWHQAQPQPVQQQGYQQQGYQQQGYQQQPYRKKKKSFLSELFDD
ncbi:TFIIB-type zinc ribbon-containing protein [Angustibacter luteus]|uniref:Zf-TFIIB domain-containing protein n=1 Tax=Angustibacter luteus TaxID=658456 RepID=A0ABW1JBB6_9ACTN